jgi:hypothetical protein
MLTFTTSSQDKETTQCDNDTKRKVSITSSINSITLQKTRHNNHKTRQDIARQVWKIHHKTRQGNDKTRQKMKQDDHKTKRTHKIAEEKGRRLR